MGSDCTSHMDSTSEAVYAWSSLWGMQWDGLKSSMLSASEAFSTIVRLCCIYRHISLSSFQGKISSCVTFFFIGWPWVIWESRAVDNCFRTWSCGTVLHRKTPGENGCCVAWRTTLSTQYTLYGCRHRRWGFLWAKIFVVYVSEEPFQIEWFVELMKRATIVLLFERERSEEHQWV